MDDGRGRALAQAGCIPLVQLSASAAQPAHSTLRSEMGIGPTVNHPNLLAKVSSACLAQPWQAIDCACDGGAACDDTASASKWSHISFYANAIFKLVRKEPMRRPSLPADLLDRPLAKLILRSHVRTSDRAGVESHSHEPRPINSKRSRRLLLSLLSAYHHTLSFSARCVVHDSCSWLHARLITSSIRPSALACRCCSCPGPAS